MIDLRSTSIPGSGREWSGANRKQKMITKEFKSYEIEEEESQSEEKVETRKESKMEEEKSTNPKANVKAKRERRSKLRRTIVF